MILKIEQQLKKLQELESSSTSPMQTISICLTGLAGLYKSVDHALNYLPHHNKAKNRAEQLVNGSLKLLDVCNASREVLTRLREAVGELRLSDDKLLEVSRYFSTRREIMRGAKELALRLRQVEGEFISENRELSQEESKLIRALRCVSIINISVVESLLQLLSSKVPRSRRQTLLSKLLTRRSKEAGELLEGKGNELSNVDIVVHAAFCKEKSDGEKMVIAQKSLEVLEKGLRGIEEGLNCISSQLAKTRASLLKHSFSH